MAGDLNRREFLTISAATAGSIALVASGCETPVSLFSRYHHPLIEGKEIPAVPYLTIPFRQNDPAVQAYDISEGWLYSPAEKKIHSQTNHCGLDFDVPYGTLIVAPTDGWVISSYYRCWLRNKNNEIRQYQGKPICSSLGLFVQVYIPTIQRYLQLAHFSEIDPAIPFSPPVLEKDDFLPTNHNLNPKDLPHHSQSIFIKKGQILGRVGVSGLTWGQTNEYQLVNGRPLIADPEKSPSWDTPHVHLEEFWRDSTGQKRWQRDPYGIYSLYKDYPTPQRQGKPLKESLFFLDNAGLPCFAG